MAEQNSKNQPQNQNQSFNQQSSNRQNNQEFKRHIAYKLRIGDILSGKPVIQSDRFKHLFLDGKEISRVNVVANIIERFNSTGDKKYSFVTMDDGSGQISVKAFGDDVEKLKDLNQGQTILAIGLLRSFNEQVYILPEIVRKKDPKYLLVRKLEVEKSRSENSKPVNKEQKVEAKDKILNKIKSSEQGIEVEELKNSLREISPQIINQEIQKFLEEGVIFEPRPGKVRYLG